MNKEVMDCLFCGEEILTTAKKCKHCGEWLTKGANDKEKNQKLKNDENIFYQDENVKVTQSRFTVGSDTYAMRNISSVTNFEIKKSKTNPILLLIGSICYMIFIKSDISYIAIIIAVLSILWFFGINNEFAVKISTNAGEPNTLVSEDKKYIQKVVDAINEAIIYRG